MEADTSQFNRYSAKRLPELDAIRGIAVLMVLVYHLYWTEVAFPVSSRSVFDYFHRILSVGWSGVELFFVLSGFLIGGILIDQRGQDRYFGPFYIRRVARILPAYLILFLPYLVVMAADSAFRNPGLSALFVNPNPLWSYATFTQNFFYSQSGSEWMAVTWSLAVEEQFYLLLPLLVWYVPPRRLPGIVLLMIPIGMLLRMAVLFVPGMGGIAGYKLLPCRWDALFLGVLGAWLVRREGFIDRCREHLSILTGGVMVFGAGVLLFGYSSQGIASTTMAQIGQSWLAVFFLLVMLTAIVLPAGRLKSGLFNPVLRWFGKYSYGLYLFHLPIVGLAHALVFRSAPRIDSMASAAVTVLGFLVTLLFSVASYHWIEERVIRYGHRFHYGPVPADAASIASASAVS